MSLQDNNKTKRGRVEMVSVPLTLGTDQIGQTLGLNFKVSRSFSSSLAYG